FSLFDGRATWDAAGKFSGVSPGGTPDVLPPTIAITQPTNSASVTGTAKLAVSATDNVAVAGVQYKLDGASLGSEQTASPFSMDWDTTKSPSGSHLLTAVARDAAGNQTTSSGIIVTVAASGTNTNLPPVTTRADKVWFDDQLPAGARAATDGGDSW